MGNNVAKITVVIAVYNSEKCLRRCVESVISQTYKDLEIILIDDGSTDGSGAICDEYAARDERIKCVHKENEGLSVARNVALSMAAGEYLSFIDSDDELRQDAYAVLVEIMRSLGVDLIKYGYTTDKAELGSCGDRPIVVPTSEVVSKLLTDEYGSQLWQYFFKAKLWMGIESPKGRFAQDMATLYLAAARAKKIAETKEKLYYYYQENPTNTSNGNRKSIRGTSDRAFAFWQRYDFCSSNEEYYSIKEKCLAKAVDYTLSCFRRKEFFADPRYENDRADFLSRLRSFGLKLLFLKGVALKKRIAALVSCVAPKIIAR